MNLNKLLEVRRAGDTKRYHLHRTIGQQTVAEHSWNVAMLIYALTDTPSPDLIKMALLHDVGERAIGDIPSHVKRDLPKEAMAHLNKIEFTFMEEVIQEPYLLLSPEESRILRMADVLELVLYCADQFQMGNTNLVEVYHKGMEYLCEIGEEDEGLGGRALEILNGFQQQTLKERVDFIQWAQK